MIEGLTLIPADEARRILFETPPVDTERVPLREAGGRVLAAALRAPEDLPVGRRAVMDGYAVRAADVHEASELATISLALVGTVPMGDVFRGAVAAGEAVAISTGGFVPAGDRRGRHGRARLVDRRERGDRALRRDRARGRAGGQHHPAWRGSRRGRRRAGRGPAPAPAGPGGAGHVRGRRGERLPPAARRRALDGQRALEPTARPRPGRGARRQPGHVWARRSRRPGAP